MTWHLAIMLICFSIELLFDPFLIESKTVHKIDLEFWSFCTAIVTDIIVNFYDL